MLLDEDGKPLDSPIGDLEKPLELEFLAVPRVGEEIETLDGADGIDVWTVVSVTHCPMPRERQKNFGLSPYVRLVLRFERHRAVDEL